MIMIALAIKLTSRGPVFYRTARIGYRGRIFELIKFRSMRDNCAKVISDFKTVVEKRDLRLTPVGSFLRIGFDELPQLINVLKGDICLIGPRPSEPSIMKYVNEVLSFKLEILPGMTGLAVICNGRSLSAYYNFVLDIWYVQHHSLWLDFIIAILTPFYMLGFRDIGKGLRRRILADWESRYPEPPFSLKD